LQFVVMTLIANRPITRDYAHAGDAFTTPTVVHFGVVLLLTAVGSAPWDGIAFVAVLWGCPSGQSRFSGERRQAK
jgi:hypothetical protein